MTEQTIPLGELCEVLDSQRRPVTKRNRTSGRFPYYGATGILDYVSDYIFDEKLVLIGEDGAKWGAGENTAFSVDGKYWVNNHAHVIRPNRDRVLDQWIVYYLNHIELLPYISGLTVPKLNQGKLREIPIPLPSLPEQERIVAILDEVFAGLATAMANVRKNLTNVRELFESYLNSVFSQNDAGWVSKRLAELGEIQSGGTPSRVVKEYWNGGIPWYSSGELNNLYTGDPERHITQTGLKNSSAKLLPKGSLLIGMYDTAAMKMSFIDRDAAFNQAIAAIKPNSATNLMFVLHALIARKAEILDQRRGVRQKNLSLEKIKNIQIEVPNLREQNRIADRLMTYRNAVASLDEVYQKKISELVQLKQSVLQKAFSGELTSPPSNAVKEAAE